jgi:two-component system, sensor histidine kinase and response regulator
MRVLVVEDNPVNRQLMRALVEIAGHQVDLAEDGEHGVAAASRTPYDIVLMDIQLPGIDGIEAMRQIRALGGHNRTIPVIAVTAHILSSQRDWLLSTGMDGYMAKPVFPADLHRMLRAWAERIHGAAAA